MIELKHALKTHGVITTSKVGICIVQGTNYQEPKIIQNDVEKWIQHNLYEKAYLVYGKSYNAWDSYYDDTT